MNPVAPYSSEPSTVKAEGRLPITSEEAKEPVKQETPNPSIDSDESEDENKIVEKKEEDEESDEVDVEPVEIAPEDIIVG